MRSYTSVDEALHLYIEGQGKFLKAFNSLQDEDKKAFAKLLMVHLDIAMGEVGEGNTPFVKNVRKVFRSLQKLCPNEKELFFTHAIFVSLIDTEEALEEGIEAFRTALRLDDTVTYAWFRFGVMLTNRANEMTHHDPQRQELYEEANRAFLKAEPAFLEEDGEKKNELYFPWSSALCELAELSGEAIDYQKTISWLIQKDGEAGASYFIPLQLSRMYIDFGKLTKRQDYFHEAILWCDKAYERAVKEHEEVTAGCFAALFRKGCAYSSLFLETLSISYFSQATDIFLKAGKIFEEKADLPIGCYDLHFEWGVMLLTGCLLTQQLHLLKTAVELLQGCVEEYKETPLHRDIRLFAYASRASGMLGRHNEELPLLNQALQNAKYGLTIDPECPELLVAEIEAIVQLGLYFNDVKYFFQAIEKGKRALEMHSDNGHLLYWLANAYYEAAEIKDDPQLYEEALRLFDGAKNGEMGRYNYFWHSFGFLFLSLAELDTNNTFYKDAECCFAQAIQLSIVPIPSYYFYVGVALQMEAERQEDESYSEKAIIAFTFAFEHDPENSIYASHLGNALGRHGECVGDLEMCKKGSQCLEKVIEKDPEDEGAWLDYGLSLLRLIEMTDDAVLPVDSSLQKKAEECFVRSVNMGCQHGCYNLACLYAFQGRVKEALDHFKKAYEVRSFPPPAEIESDPWFDNLRKEPLFQETLHKMKKG